jgi:hypothetical protein
MGSNNIINDFLKYQHIERFNTSEVEDSDFTSKQIPKLLNTVYYDLIREES